MLVGLALVQVAGLDSPTFDNAATLAHYWLAPRRRDRGRTTVLCPSCGHENREGASFCDGCGAPLAAVCPRCGAQLRPSARFCDSCGQAISEPAAPPTPAPTAPTSFAAGRYQVKRFLGEGGRKRLSLAHDTRLDRDVAFSLIKTEGLDASGLARVRREAQAMGHLGDHPNIVTMFDIGEEAGQPYVWQRSAVGVGADIWSAAHDVILSRSNRSWPSES